MVELLGHRCFFINIAILQFAVLSQIVYAILPGKNPTNFYICSGTIPNLIPKELTKWNYFPTSSISFDFFFYTFLCIKIRIFKSKETQNSSTQVQNNISNGWTLPPIQNKTDGFTLANIGSIGLFLTTYIPLFVVYPLINNLSLEKLASYPYFLVARFLHHGFPLLWNIFSVIIFLSKSGALRRELLRDVFEVSSKIKEKWNL
jgi:hypothetical protein